MLRPLCEFVGVHRDVLGKLLDDDGVFKEEHLKAILVEFRHTSGMIKGFFYCAISRPETVDPLLRCRLAIFRNHRIQDILGKVPELSVFVVEEQNNSGGLRIERTWYTEDSVLDELLDPGIGDQTSVFNLVESSTSHNRTHQSL
jgi:hypothetical protein